MYDNTNRISASLREIIKLALKECCPFSYLQVSSMSRENRIEARSSVSSRDISRSIEIKEKDRRS